MGGLHEIGISITKKIQFPPPEKPTGIPSHFVNDVRIEVSAAHVEFSDLFEIYCRRLFKMRRSEAIDALTTSDSQQVVELDDSTVGFFLKRMKVSKNKQAYVLVEAVYAKNRWVIHIAYWLSSELVESAHTHEPVVLLQHLSQSFGLLIRIGHQFSKFILRETIVASLDSGDMTPVIESRDVPDELIVQTMLKHELREDQIIIHCALAYALIITDYLQWLYDSHIIDPNHETRLDDFIVLPQFNGKLSEEKLLIEAGTIMFPTNYSARLCTFKQHNTPPLQEYQNKDEIFSLCQALAAT